MKKTRMHACGMALALILGATASALEPGEVITMAQSGVQDSAIINMVQGQKLSRPLNAQEVMALNAGGASSTLLEFLTRSDASVSAPVSAPAPVIVTEAPVVTQSTTIVESAPMVVTAPSTEVIVTSPPTVYYDSTYYSYPYYYNYPRYSFGFSWNDRRWSGSRPHHRPPSFRPPSHGGRPPMRPPGGGNRPRPGGGGGHRPRR